MGGELFSDDKYFDDYLEYCRIVNKSFPNLEIKFVFITNFLYTK